MLWEAAPRFGFQLLETCKPCSEKRLARNGFVEVIAKPIRRDDKEHVEILTVTFIDTSVRDTDTIGLQLSLYAVDVINPNGRAVL